MKEHQRVTTILGAVLFFWLAWMATNTHGQTFQGPQPDPIMRLDPDMHTGWIKRIGIDQNCKHLVTAGRDDKTARLWEIPANIHDSPKLIRKFRHPIGAGNFGKVYAVAISPNGGLVAIGGWDIGYLSPGHGTNYVYIFDSSTGDLLKRVGGFDDVILHLSFSQDGQFLVAGLFGPEGIRIWDTGNWSLIPNNGQYEGNVFGALFDDHDRLYTVSYDGHVRILAREGDTFKQIRETKTKYGKSPYSIAINLDKHVLAIGFSDVPNVEVYDSDTLSSKRESPLLAEDDQGRISTGVTWSTDGGQLFVTLSPENDFGPKILRVWDVIKGEYKLRSPDITLNLPLLGSTVQLVTCNAQLFVAANEGFGVFDSTTKQVKWAEGSKPVFTVNKGDLKHRMRVSADGSRVAFSLEHGGGNQVVFDVANQRLSKVSADDVTALHRADTDSLPISDWEFSLTPKLNGKSLTLEKHERAMALAISPDKNRFILGTEWRLHAYDKDGKEYWCEDITCKRALPVEGAVVDLNISKDGQLVVSAHSDGTIRWRRISDGEVLLSLFVNKGDNRWIAWTPKGYFIASIGGESLVGWHINRGLDQKADWYPLHVFRDKFLRPDIVKLVLATRDEGAAIIEANKNNEARSSDNRTILDMRAPVVDIINPRADALITTDTLQIEYVVRSPGHLATKLTAMIDGKLVYQGPFDPQNVNKKLTLTLDSPQGGENLTLSAYAEALNNPDNPTTIVMKWRPEGAQVPLKPKLFALVIGIKVGLKADPLKWADIDAQHFGELLQAQPQGEKGLYRGVAVLPPLLNENATKDNIVIALTNLKNEMINESERTQGKVQDIAVIFYSGHGTVNDNGTFFLATPPPPNTEVRYATQFALNAVDLKEHIGALPGRRVLLLDACRSGGVLADNFNSASLINGLSDVIYIYSSAQENQLSFECEQHGCFTEALIGGIKGGADTNVPPFNSITTGEMESYLDSHVPLLRGNKKNQIPLYHTKLPSRLFELFRPLPNYKPSTPLATEAGQR
jgi:WD40 repeat protein